MNRPVTILIVAGLMMMPVYPAAVADDEEWELMTPEEIMESANDWAEENLSDEALAAIRSLGEGDWATFWDNVQSALESDSLDDLAWAKPQVATSLKYVDQIRNAGEYADWLRQRLDYFEVADEAVRKFPPERPLPVPVVKQPVPPPGTAKIPPAPVVQRPPPEVKHSKTAARTEIQRNSAIRNSATWEARIARRPLPESASDLIPRLKRIFKTEGIPQELVWLAEVESSLNPRARSPAGAVGLFQLMPATARQYGLRTAPLDQRRHPELSAMAAAKHLKDLYRQAGSWPLALAAYNSGGSRVRKLMKAHKADTFDEIADYLPLETRMYVPKVEATIRIREGRSTGTLPPPTV